MWNNRFDEKYPFEIMTPLLFMKSELIYVE